MQFFLVEIALRYVRAGCFCFSGPFVHILYCVFFSGEALASADLRPEEAFQLYPCFYMLSVYIFRNPNNAISGIKE